VLQGVTVQSAGTTDVLQYVLRCVLQCVAGRGFVHSGDMCRNLDVGLRTRLYSVLDIHTYMLTKTNTHTHICIC